MPTNSSRWVGLNNASRSCSIPNSECQVMSPAPPTANTTTPTTARPYPAGNAASPDRSGRRVRAAVASTQAAVARKPE